MARLILASLLFLALSCAVQVECGGRAAHHHNHRNKAAHPRHGDKAASYHSLMAAKHERWMARHGRVYKDDAEKARRLEVFKTNVEFVRDFSKNKGNRTFTVRLNAFADMTLNEFRLSYTGGDVLHLSNLAKKKSPSVSKSKYGGFIDYGPFGPIGGGGGGGNNDDSSSLDWRTKDAVTPVKDQGSCGNNFDSWRFIYLFIQVCYIYI